MPDAKAQGFFEGLPPDGFLSSEEELREVWVGEDLWMDELEDHLLKALELQDALNVSGERFGVHDWIYHYTLT